LLAPKKGQKSQPPAKKQTPAPRLKPAPTPGPYFHIADINMLPGRVPGQPLVNPDARKKARRKRK
jgi:hypothetical protein